MPTRPDAIGWPCGALRLAHCAACGFITNTAFDPASQQLSARYEATQACSPTFGKFAQQLAQDWIDRYELRGKRVLEIGCGQGEFITMLCDAAGATGWGLDPIVEPSRFKSERVDLIAEKFGPKWYHLQPDFIICRHTLEHIPDVSVFLKSIRASLAQDTQTVVAIEVPDNQRVMSEAAFWDIYYEHCSYFDATSLPSALRLAGFAVIDHRLEFGGQYLVTEARPSAMAPTPANAKPKSTPLAAADSLAAFVDKCSQRLSWWSEQLQ
ncbi:MAG TPA: class I SAM-dependent methyltransferase, partial [Tepidisphaeraceae bacterium]|nr:class I SAM-dependent methyltransferase [Tepidisphaeraceae bacterium]